ncbi:MAG: hypothetical protein MZV65_54370 [Chromatiales bacterium]|nr:hypothetical protein [Chromatiales bacterium]
MLPADQRLGADDSSAGEVDLRLVVQPQLAALERAGAGCDSSANRRSGARGSARR